MILSNAKSTCYNNNTTDMKNFSDGKTSTIGVDLTDKNITRQSKFKTLTDLGLC